MGDKNNTDVSSSKVSTIVLLIIFGGFIIYVIYSVALFESLITKDYEPTENINLITKEGDHFLLYEEHRNAFTEQYYRYKICEIKNGNEITIKENLTRQAADKLNENSPYKFSGYLYNGTKVKIYLIQNFIMFKTDKDSNYDLKFLIDFEGENVKNYVYLTPFFKELLKNNDSSIYIPTVVFLIKTDNVESFKDISESVKNAEINTKSRKAIMDYIRGYPNTKDNQEEFVKRFWW